MPWLAVDESGEENLFIQKPTRQGTVYPKRFWWCDLDDLIFILPDGTIEKHILGRKLTWQNEPVEIKEVTK